MSPAPLSRCCPRCGKTITPTWIGPDLDHPGGQRVLVTFGPDGWCGDCDWSTPGFLPEHREVLPA